MANENLFDTEETDQAEAKAKAEHDKRLKELEAKLGSLSDELNNSKKTWEDERKQLENKLSETTKKAANADNWDKLINDNPSAAAKMILDYQAAKDTASKGVNRGGGNGQQVEDARIAKLEERLSKQEKESQESAARNYMIEMQNAIGEVMDELKEYGIEPDSKLIIQHLQENEYLRPTQVRDATYGLYRDQVFNAVKKRKSEDKDGVVMGTQGYSTGTENQEENIDVEKTDINDLWNTVASKLK